MTLNIRNIPCATNGIILDQYYEGESVIYDYVIITNKYVWISWISSGGRRVYMAIKDQITEERFATVSYTHLDVYKRQAIDRTIEVVEKRIAKKRVAKLDREF